MPAAIRIDELTKDYAIGFWRRRPYRALDRLSLEIAPGEVFGFLGPNGAGKTTTLKLLMQLIFPSSGRAEILGRPVGDLATRQRIGYLPENPHFYDHLTAEELLTYFARLFGYRGAALTARVTSLLDRVAIGAERRLQLRKFSKGMIQRIGIAQALVNDPEVVFLDEPMSGLDPLGRRDVRKLILELRDQGRTVFFSSHILADAEALCRRVAVVAGGRLAASGRLTDILAFEVHGWEYWGPYHDLWVAGDYEGVVAKGRESIEANPHPMPLYNLACCESLAGHSEDAIKHLGMAIELWEDGRDLARKDSDFDPIRDEPGFKELIA